MICASYTRQTIKFGEAISISEQEKAISEFVKSKRMTIDKAYTDQSNDVEAEDGFNTMKEGGINRAFDCIVFYSMMYFGKEPLVGYNLILHSFIPAGIDFAVASDNFISIGKSSEEINDYLKLKYKERRMIHYNKISIYAKDTRANTLYGYEKHGDEFCVDNKVSDVVRHIFSLALDGKSPKEIAAVLTKERIEPSHIYLAKEAGKETLTLPKEWKTSAIKKIMTDSRYMGKRTTTKCGKQFTLSMEPYITEEHYDKIQSTFKKVEHTNERWTNPLHGLIFDKDTGIKMYSGNYLSNGNRYYYIANNNEVSRQYKVKAILADDVLKSVSDLLVKEHDLALHILNCLNSEMGKAEISSRMVSLKDKLDEAYQVLIDNLSNTDSELSFESADKAFAGIQIEYESNLKAFSTDNPWIKLFKDYEPENLTVNFCRKYISKVLIEKNEKVEIVPLFSEWKSRLPDYWLEVK